MSLSHVPALCVVARQTRDCPAREGISQPTLQLNIGHVIATNGMCQGVSDEQNLLTGMRATPDGEATQWREPGSMDHPLEQNHPTSNLPPARTSM